MSVSSQSMLVVPDQHRTRLVVLIFANVSLGDDQDARVGVGERSQPGRFGPLQRDDVDPGLEQDFAVGEARDQRVSSTLKDCSEHSQGSETEALGSTCVMDGGQGGERSTSARPLLGV